MQLSCSWAPVVAPPFSPQGMTIVTLVLGFTFIVEKGRVLMVVCKTWRTETEQRMRKKITFRNDATDHKERLYKWTESGNRSLDSSRKGLLLAPSRSLEHATRRTRKRFYRPSGSEVCSLSGLRLPSTASGPRPGPEHTRILRASASLPAPFFYSAGLITVTSCCLCGRASSSSSSTSSISTSAFSWTLI